MESTKGHKMTEISLVLVAFLALLYLVENCLGLCEPFIGWRVLPKLRFFSEVADPSKVAENSNMLNLLLKTTEPNI